MPTNPRISKTHLFIGWPVSLSINAIALSVAVLFFLCGCATAPVGIPGTQLHSMVLNHSEFSRYLEARDGDPVSQIHFHRNSTGSALFINYLSRKGNAPEYRTLIVTAAGMREIPGYFRVWYGDEAQPIFRSEGVKEWYDDAGQNARFFSNFDDASFVFDSGKTIPFKTISGIAGVTGEGLAMLHFKGRGEWHVVAAAHPELVLVKLPPNFEFPEVACATPRELFILGKATSADGKRITKCLTYKRSSRGYDLLEDVPIWGGNVYDFYPETGDTLLSGTATKFAGFYHFNIRTKKIRRLAAAADEWLFLKDDVIKVLEEALRPTK